MHATVPASKSIKRFFDLSGKRHLLITGEKGIGKSTLFQKLVPALAGAESPQITTFAVPKEAVYFRFGTQTIRIGRYCEQAGKTENKMRLDENLSDICALILRQLAACENAWVAIDEIGYLEEGSTAYMQALWDLMAQKRLLAVIRKQETPFLRKLKNRQDVCLLDLDALWPDIGCIIMASGESRRFGSNKLLAPFDGKPVLEWVLRANDLPFAKVVAVTRSEEVARLCESCQIEVIRHAFPDRNDTIRIGVEAMETAVSTLKGCLFCAGDQPLLSKETMEVMALMIQMRPERIHRLCFGTQKGMPVYFPSAYFSALQHLPQGSGGRSILRENAEKVVCVTAKNEWELFDVDTPAQLQFLLERKKAEGI